MDRPPYRQVLRLYLIAADFWPSFDGEASLNGVDLLSLHPARFLNAIYYMAVRSMDEKDRGEFDFKLDQPLHGESVRQEDVRDELMAFDALMGAQR